MKRKLNRIIYENSETIEMDEERKMSSLHLLWNIPDKTGRSLHGVMAKMQNCNITVSRFELQQRYYVHFRINSLGEDMNPLITPVMRLLLSFYKDGFGIK